MRRRFQAALLVLALALGSTGCSLQLYVDHDELVGADAAEQRILDRHEAAQGAGIVMFLVSLVVVPLGVTALFIATLPRNRQ